MNKRVNPERLTGAIMFGLLLLGFFTHNRLFVEHSVGGLIATAVVAFLRHMDRGQQ